MLSWPRPSLQLLLLLIQPAASSLLPGNATDGVQEVIVAAILPQTNTSYAWAWPRVGPALQAALDRINSDPWLLPGLSLRLVYRNSEDRDGLCSHSMAPLAAVDLHMDHEPWVFLGPGCTYSSSHVARFTAHWDVPMVTAGAQAWGFWEHGTVTNTGPTHKKLGQFAARVQDAFGWRHRAVLLYTRDTGDDGPCFFAAEGLYNVLLDRNVSTYHHQLHDVDYRALVQDIRDNGRVVYACCSRDVFRTLLVQFWRDGVDLKDYVFFFINLFADGLEDRGPVRPWFRGDSEDRAARLAFRSVKVLTYYQPPTPQYLQFTEDLKRNAKKMFNFTITDSVALNETLSQQRPGPGPVPRPRGDTLTHKMWNRIFPGE
ncbi:atrial natriuretic peptide receptor 1-like isoform X2 [Salarias fasciatus]|uniref:atrial natriuretic peptide receptor 1-like isoform X2 n=1 Tax=Salarias fasciatus TaxID=181472 RepID=UPI0011766A28|nr:atrial natriuretic peptide receptor 1-like isoform X2 [Salarias fasciatus]